jgi:hypothetical protein
MPSRLCRQRARKHPESIEGRFLAVYLAPGPQRSYFDRLSMIFACVRD